MNKKVIVFGVFDGIHEGHRAFLRQASAEGDYLMAVLARDQIINQLKGRLPDRSFAERFRDLKKEKYIDMIISGDAALGSWNVLDVHRPAVIALGYDQQQIKKDLDDYFAKAGWRAEIKVMQAHEGNRYHSSVIRVREA